MLGKFAKMRVRLEHTISRALRELRLLQTKPKDPKPQIRCPYLLDDDIDTARALLEELRKEEEEEEEDLEQEQDQEATAERTPVSEWTHEDPDRTASIDPSAKTNPECPPQTANVAKCHGQDANLQNEPNSLAPTGEEDGADEEMLS